MHHIRFCTTVEITFLYQLKLHFSKWDFAEFVFVVSQSWLMPLLQRSTAAKLLQTYVRVKIATNPNSTSNIGMSSDSLRMKVRNTESAKKFIGVRLRLKVILSQVGTLLSIRGFEKVEK